MGQFLGLQNCISDFEEASEKIRLARIRLEEEVQQLVGRKVRILHQSSDQTLTDLDMIIQIDKVDCIFEPCHDVCPRLFVFWTSGGHTASMSIYRYYEVTILE